MVAGLAAVAACGALDLPTPEQAEQQWIARDDAACRSGSASCCERLAGRYLHGQGVDQDGAQAASYYQLACASGTPANCIALAKLLSDGQLMPPDYERARGVLQQTCERGDGLACYDLARMCMDGKGGAKDYAAAVPLLEKACAKNQSDACRAQDEIERQRLVRQDLGRFAGGHPPDGLSLATSPARYAAPLKEWFKGGIQVPFPYAIEDIPAAPKDLSTVTDVRNELRDSQLVVSGRVSVGRLPKGFHVSEHSPQPGSYRRWVMGYVISPDGKVLWSDEASFVDGDWSDGNGSRPAKFSIVADAPRQSLTNASLVLLVTGDPISICPEDRGGAVVLGAVVKPL